MPEFDPALLTPKQRAKLITASVVPRPIALVTTLGPDGPNAAPFSFFGAAGGANPMLMLSIGPKGAGQMKDTVRNIEALPEFVVHIVDERDKEKMNLCSTEWDYGVDEITRSGFRTEPSRKVRPPRLADCPVQMECRLIHSAKLGPGPQTLIVGEVVHFHYREGLVDMDRLYVNVPEMHAMGRMEGADMYVRTTDRFSLRRPDRPDGTSYGD